jgi:hypothetical protein
VSDEDHQEIISRPASHPIATTLLILSMLATILGIAFVWAELFGEYLPAPKPGETPGNHSARKIAEKHVKDHYKVDFPNENTMGDIERVLGISSQVGGQEGLGAGN